MIFKYSLNILKNQQKIRPAISGNCKKNFTKYIFAFCGLANKL